VRRREFIAGLGGAAAWPVVARGQQAAMPVIGYLGSGSLGASTEFDAFRRGLKDNGYLVGENLAIEFVWAERKSSQCPH